MVKRLVGGNRRSNILDVELSHIVERRKTHSALIRPFTA